MKQLERSIKTVNWTTTREPLNVLFPDRVNRFWNKLEGFILEIYNPRYIPALIPVKRVIKTKDSKYCQ